MPTNLPKICKKRHGRKRSNLDKFVAAHFLKDCYFKNPPELQKKYYFPIESDKIGRIIKLLPVHYFLLFFKRVVKNVHENGFEISACQ